MIFLVLIGVLSQRSVGLFVLNAAEGWVDVKKNGQGILGSLSNMVSGASQPKQVEKKLFLIRSILPRIWVLDFILIRPKYLFSILEFLVFYWIFAKNVFKRAHGSTANLHYEWLFTTTKSYIFHNN